MSKILDVDYVRNVLRNKQITHTSRGNWQLIEGETREMMDSHEALRALARELADARVDRLLRNARVAGLLGAEGGSK